MTAPTPHQRGGKRPKKPSPSKKKPPPPTKPSSPPNPPHSSTSLHTSASSLALACHHTHPWKTFDYEDVKRSDRFSYLADPLLQRGYSLQRRRRDVFLSLFAFHNETINVWSHLLGGILFVVLFYNWWSHVMSGTQGAVLAEEMFAKMADNGASTLELMSSKLFEMSREAREYSHALTEEANVMRSQTRAMAESVAVSLSKMDFRSEVEQKVLTLESWLAEEKQAMQEALHEFGERGGEWLRHAAIVEWISSNMRGENVTQALSEHLGKFIPTDFEGRRAVAALRGWLNEERQTLENLLFRFDRKSTSVPVWPVMVFCFGGIICLGCSALYHLFACHCRDTHDMLCRVDLAGISFMIWGSIIPVLYYVFYEDPFWQTVYIVGSTILCSATLMFCALPADVLHRAKKARVLSYCAAGSFLVAPFFHAVWKWGMFSPQVLRYTNDGYMALVGFFYVFGAFIYISRFPEKHFPGKFDLFFASHQIWHILVFLAALVHYYGAVELYLWRVELELHNKIDLVKQCGVVAATLMANVSSAVPVTATLVV